MSRRTFLLGLGATVALPFLDGMIPAFAAGSATRSARRLGIIYVPNGAEESQAEITIGRPERASGAA